MLEKYGVEYPMQSKIIQDKMINTKLKTGSYLSKEKKTEYKNYLLQVRRITNKYKKRIV